MTYELFDVTTTRKCKCITKHKKMTNLEMCSVLSAGLYLVSNDKFQQRKREEDGKEKIKFYVEEGKLKITSTVNIWNTIYVISELLAKMIVA